MFFIVKLIGTLLKFRGQLAVRAEDVNTGPALPRDFLSAEGQVSLAAIQRNPAPDSNISVRVAQEWNQVTAGRKKNIVP